MGGVVWLQGSEASLLDWGPETEKRIKDLILSIMEDVVNDAAAKMRDFISSRGLPNSKGSGRIDTGNMLASVDAEITIDGENINGKFGWLAGGEVYFLAQEEGAVLWNGGVIMPMLALYDAGQWAITEFANRVRAAL